VLSLFALYVAEGSIIEYQVVERYVRCERRNEGRN
jgi:hypothetical protein